jgi:hypothetical protein
MNSSPDIDHPQLLALPQTPLALDVIELVTQAGSPALSNHSLRSYLFARLVFTRPIPATAFLPFQQNAPQATNSPTY